MSKYCGFFLIVACILLMSGSLMSFPLGINEATYYNTTYAGFDFDYVQVYDFYEDGFLGNPYGFWVGNNSSLTWTHTHGFAVPPDAIDDAYLLIEAAYVNTDGTEVEIEGEAEWDNLNQGWTWKWWKSPSQTLYDLTSLPEYTWSDGLLEVMVETPRNELFGIRIDKSTLAMNATESAVPEPATMLLFGFGLAGVGVYRRFKKN